MGGLFLVSGNDEFAIKARAREHIEKLCGADFEQCSDLESIRGDADDVSPASVLSAFADALATPPFLSPRKVVWLRHFNAFPAACDASGDPLAAAAARVAGFFARPLPDDLFAVIDGPDLDQRKSFCKQLKQVEGAVVDFYKKADLADRDYSRTQAEKISALARKHRKQLPPDALEYLANAVGSDSGRMLSEFEKLVTYAGDDKVITLEACRAVVSRTPEALAWEFANAIVSGDPALALAAADNAIESMNLGKNSGNCEMALISQAARAFRDIMDTHIAAAELHLPPNVGRNYFYDISPEMKTRFPENLLLKVHPFRAFKMVETAGRFPAGRIAPAMRALLEANRKLVSSSEDPRMVVEAMIVKICG